ncbi:MAG: hypothetical protein AAB225_11585 [Acidobacteriota bacterium]
MPMRTLGWLALLAALAGAQQAPVEQKYEETQKLVHRYWEEQQFAKALPLLEELRRDPRLLQFPEYRSNVLYNLACGYSRVGDKARAVEMLKESARAGISNFKHAETDKDLDNIRNEAGYKEALDRMRALAAFWDGPPLASGFRERLTEEEKITGLSKSWAEVKYNFAWFDNVPDLNWDALYVEYMRKARQANTMLEYYRLLRELCARLKAGHTYITPPREIREQLDFKPPLRTGLIEGKVLVLELLDPALEGDGVRCGL